MLPAPSNSIPLFRAAGIQVSLHWWWFVVALIEISYRRGAYTSVAWNVAEYLALFVIVLLHEFGHALACRQTGGQADHIVLWPFGGVAFVKPPQRPGAQLWSIAAGPLVNVLLVPVLSGLIWARMRLGWGAGDADYAHFLLATWWINVGLLLFNLMPVYPLDGGQIVRSLLWFVFGRARSLYIASVIGFIGVAALLVLAILRMDLWLGLIVIFIGQQCVHGYRQAQALRLLEKLPRHAGFACPTCQQPPPSGAIWLCPACGHRFDAFLTRGICPHCQTPLATIPCVDCGAQHPIDRWDSAAAGGKSPVIDI